MKKAAFLIFIFSCTLSTLSAQEWVKMMRDPKANFHDVQKAFNEWNDAREKNKSKKANQNTSAENEEEGNYQLFKRWEWYMEPRTYPSGVIPQSNLTADNYKQYKAQKSSGRLNRTQSINQWIYSGNTNVPVSGGGDGRVNRICFYPGNDSIIFACTPFGGLWKSTNAGLSWTTNTDNLVSIATSDLAINPLNPKVMYLSTGDGDGYDQPSIGVLKTSDGGQTWDTTGLYYTLQLSGPANVMGGRIVVNPLDTALILAATTGGLYMSKNSGFTWAKCLNEDVKSLEFEPFHNSTIYASTSNGKFFRSLDSGYTFTLDTTGLSLNGNAGRITIGVTPADSNVVYLLAEKQSTSGFYGIYLSTDRGQTFTAKNLQSTDHINLLGWAPSGNDSTGQGWYTLSLAVSPTNPDTLMVGGVNLWVSGDKGVTWNIAGEWQGLGAPYVHADIHELTYLPGNSASYFAACDGGIFTKASKLNISANWTDLSNNLAIGQQYSIGLSAITQGFSVSGWQDNGTNASGSVWAHVLGGDGEVCFIDYTDDRNVFASSQNGYLQRSTNGGFSWSSATTNITESGPWTTRWMQDPQFPDILYAGFKNVWESGTQGVQWGQFTNWGSYYICAMAVSPTNDQYFYAAQPNLLYGTSDGGVTWTNITAGLPTGYAAISGVAVDPTNPNRIWVTFSGWVATEKVFQSNDGGKNWTNISGALPNLPINCIVAQDGSPNSIYIGTDIGVYYRDTILNSWIDYSNGLPDVMIDDLKIDAPNNTLYAATYGRGTWTIPTNYLTGINEMSLNRNIKVYPNPTSGKTQILLDMPGGDYNIAVTNVLGQAVFSDKIHTSGQYNYELDMSTYGKGMYFISIGTGSAKTVKKLVVY